jgi:hypoxanthine phosphoribosyltransferase
MILFLQNLLSLRKIRVHSFDKAALKQAAADLAARTQDFSPNVIIGIRSGGYFVAKLMAESLPQAVLLAITCRRPSTQKKQRYTVVKRLLANLPHFVTNRLRVLEHILMTALRAPKPVALAPDPGELATIEQALRKLGDTARILIVDDAVDSGVTMAAVRDAINAVANPAAGIKIAAITVTTPNPLVEPDFSLYRYVLCRFLWSLDSKSRNRADF